MLKSFNNLDFGFKNGSYISYEIVSDPDLVQVYNFRIQTQLMCKSHLLESNLQHFNKKLLITNM